MPTYGLPDARRRAIEFVLDLGVYRRIQEHNHLLTEVDRLRNEYRQAVMLFRGELQNTGLIIQGLDLDPPTRWPEVDPRLMVATEAAWMGIAEYIRSLRHRRRTVVEQQVPTAEQASRQLEEQLHRNENTLDRLTAAASELHDRLALDDEQLESLSHRIEALEEDRRRYQDALTLQEFGGQGTVAILEGNDCPACHRPLPAALVLPEAPPPMSLEQNLGFISEQIRLMQGDVQRHRDVTRQRLSALHTRIEEVRREIRAARATLTSPANSPSVAAVREQLQLEDRLASLEEIERNFAGLIEDLRPIVGAITQASMRLSTLPSERLDTHDESRLSALESSLVSQLNEYGFRSFPVETIGISRENYLPTREGFDLGFVTSASDAIRIVWSYLLGLLEVGQSQETNHLGLLMFDEPRQQAADPVSYRALLRRAAGVVSSGGQIVFATSEPDESVRGFLRGIRYEQVTFENMVLQPAS